MSEIFVCPFNKSKNKAHLYDRDKQAWMLETNLHTQNKTLHLRLYYADIHNVPRKFSRYVCWNAILVPVQIHAKPQSASGAPFSNYYAQTDTDDGFVMKTDIPVAEVRKKGN